MPSIYELKPKFQALLRPITQRLARLGVTANQVTVSAALLSISIGGLLLLGSTALFWLVPATMLVRMALNAIDGMLAREHNMKSDLGAILNELGDVVSDAALYLPFAFVPGISPVLIVLFVIFAIISEMTGVIAIQVGATRRYDGPMGKSDRAVLFGGLSILLALGIQTGWWMNAALTLALTLLLLTIFNRITATLKEKRKGNSQ